MKKPTIYEIKRLTAETSPYFFSSKTLKFFGQTLSSFHVVNNGDGRFRIAAPCYDGKKYMGATIRYFNPITNELEIK